MRRRSISTGSGEAGLARIVMSPELVKTPTVDRAFLLAPGIGYLRITEFEEPTGKLVREKIEELGGPALQGLVLDLRDNPGGAVTAAVDTASLFLKGEHLIFTVKGRSAKPDEVRVLKYNQPYKFPLVVLVNEKSASASEIVSGALQDHDRAAILGVPTYGKGLVQQVYPLSGHAGMALTTAFYYTPSGRSIQRPLSGGQLDAATVVDQGPYKTDSGREVLGRRRNSARPGGSAGGAIAPARGHGRFRRHHLVCHRVSALARNRGGFRGHLRDDG